MNRTKVFLGVMGLALAFLVSALAAGNFASRHSQQSAEDLYQAALLKKEAEGDLNGAIKLFQDILTRFPDKRDIAAKSQLQIGFCYEKLGMQEAQKAFEAVVKNYPGQAEEVKIAKEKLVLLRKARSIAEKSAQESTTRHVLSWNDLTINGSISPDERFISLTDWSTGDQAIKELATGKERRLTNKGVWDEAHPGYASKSIWSPDSQRVAYTWDDDRNYTGLHEIGLGDSVPRLICGAKDGVWLAPIEWSLDGKNIFAKVFHENAVDLSLISVTDGSMRVLKTFPDRGLPPGNAFLSPDGRHVAYSYPPRKEVGTSDIFLLTIADGREIPLVQHPAHDNLLGWLPDGRGILFSSDRTGRIDAWTLMVNAAETPSSPAMVKGNIGTVDPLAMTRDGKFYFSTPGSLRSIFTASLDSQTGRLISPATKEPLTYEGNNMGPTWSPDGKTLAYTSWRELARKESLLCLYSTDTKGIREISFDKRLGHARWTPDGHHLLLQAASIDGGGIYQVEVQSGKAMEVLKAGEKKNLHAAQISPDGNALVYGEEDGAAKTYRILVQDTITKQVREVARTSFTNNTAALSPDGKHLAMILRQQRDLRVLTVMDFPEGGSREILKFKVDGSFYIDLAWSPDGRFIYFSQPSNEKGNWDLWRVGQEGGAGQKLGVTMRRFESISIHPDGRRITFASIAPEGEFPQIWVMENFLPAAGVAAEKDAGEFRVRKAWDAPLDDWFVGSPSSDGRYLTYTSEQDFLSLGVRDLVKGESHLIRHNKSWQDAEESCSYSIFSPDASQIAYSCQVGRRHQLRIVNIDGTSLRILHDGRNVSYQIPENLTPFGWTSDGKQILTHFSRGDNISGIAFISAVDGSVKYERGLSLKVPWGKNMSLSPDERYIAGTYLPREDSANKDIFLLSLEGGKEVPLVEHPADDKLIGWSPDGRQVLFASDRTGTMGIWSVRVAEGKAKGAPELVRGNMGNILPLGMTGDGKLYYGIATGSSDVFIAPLDPATGKVLAPPAKAVRKYETFNSAPDWSPDGQFLACRSSRGKAANESPVLLIRSMQTNEIRELIPKTPRGRLNYYWLRWSPDGRSFLAIGMDENGEVGALLAVDAQTGEAKIVSRADSGVDERGNIIAPEWSSDGKSIYFVRIGEQFRRVCRLDLEAGVEKEICRFPEVASGPFWLASSPDGQKLALHAEGKIKILSSDGTDSQDLTEAERGTVLAWTADGKNILYGEPKEGSKGVVELWVVPVSGGEPQKAGLSMSQLLLLRVSPDGRNIAFTASEQPSRSEVWVMENFLPR